MSQSVSVRGEVDFKNSKVKAIEVSNDQVFPDVIDQAIADCASTCVKGCGLRATCDSYKRDTNPGQDPGLAFLVGVGEEPQYEHGKTVVINCADCVNPTKTQEATDIVQGLSQN